MPRKNAWALKSISGTGQKFAGNVQMKSDVFRYI
jgi:hypothetical protein